MPGGHCHRRHAGREAVACGAPRRAHVPKCFRKFNRPCKYIRLSNFVSTPGGCCHRRLAGREATARGGSPLPAGAPCCPRGLPVARRGTLLPAAARRNGSPQQLAVYGLVHERLADYCAVRQHFCKSVGNKHKIFIFSVNIMVAFWCRNGYNKTVKKQTTRKQQKRSGT